MTLYLFRICQCPKHLQQRIVLALTTTTTTTQCDIVGLGQASIIPTSLVIHYNVTATTLHKVVKAQTNAYLLTVSKIQCQHAVYSMICRTQIQQRRKRNMKLQFKSICVYATIRFSQTAYQSNTNKKVRDRNEDPRLTNKMTNSCMSHRDLLDYCYVCWATTELNMKVSFRQRGTGNQDLMF